MAQMPPMPTEVVIKGNKKQHRRPIFFFFLKHQTKPKPTPPSVKFANSGKRIRDLNKKPEHAIRREQEKLENGEVE